MRRLAFFGSENSSFPDLSLLRRTCCSWRFTVSVPVSRSMSDHLSPNASPCLSPAMRQRAYSASNLSPRAASRSFPACSASRGFISCWRTFGLFAWAAGLRSQFALDGLFECFV